MLPRSVHGQLVPVSAAKAHQQVAAKKCRALNANYSLPELMERLAVKSPFNLYYDAIVPRSAYLSAPQVTKEFLFDGNDQATYTAELSYIVAGDGLFTGFKGSFVAMLSASVVLDISGDDIAGRATSDSWKHCYLPIQDPIRVQRGDEIHLRFTRSYPSHRESPFRQCYRWSGENRRQGKVTAIFDQSTGDLG